MAVTFRLNGADLVVDQDAPGRTLLDALRTEGGITSAKDGCAPQGQCGCCTVLVDGKARVACVTPLRRVAGREVTTLEGLESDVARRWGDAMLASGGSQCGFCTPGIIMRLEDRRRRDVQAAEPVVAPAAIDRALAAHLCRCTGWQGISEAAVAVLGSPVTARSEDGPPLRSEDRPVSDRATLESSTPQHVDAAAVLGGGGFAADTAPRSALVAVPGADGGWVVAETLHEARSLAGKVQGRRSTLETTPPIDVPTGSWRAALSTSWVEPAYLETDASWCEPGGVPADPLANGGAFGAKRKSALPAVARRLADEHGRTVLALWAREDVVRHGPKRPPMGIGLAADGTGTARVVRTPGIAAAIRSAAPGVVVEEVELPGPPTSADIRGAGWAEAFCAMVAVDAPSPIGGRDHDGVRVELPSGARARVAISDGGVRVEVDAGDPIDEVVLGSFVIGAVHMAAGWVCSEGLAVDAAGSVQDLTIRSFGILTAAQMPAVEVVIDPGSRSRPPVAVADAVFAATAAAVWWRHGFAPRWPLGRPVL